MAQATPIEWTDATWNPIRGCARVSEGCRNCYAEKTAARFIGKGQAYADVARRDGGEARWTGVVKLIRERLRDPILWRKPSRIFVNSMSDMFHERVPDDWIDEIFAVMALSPRHTFQILTKRPQRMHAYLGGGRQTMAAIVNAARATSREIYEASAIGGCHWWPLPNVWLGVSVENQAAADERIPLLLRTPAAVRFLSCEPLLGPLDLYNGDPDPRLGGHQATETYIGEWWEPGAVNGPPKRGVDWVIAGGESGPRARPAHPDWFRSLRDQCAAANVPFFFKQWGEHAEIDGPRCGDLSHDRNGTEFFMSADGARHDTSSLTRSVYGTSLMARVGKKKAGRLLDGRTHDDFPVLDPRPDARGHSVRK